MNEEIDDTVLDEALAKTEGQPSASKSAKKPPYDIDTTNVPLDTKNNEQSMPRDIIPVKDIPVMETDPHAVVMDLDVMERYARVFVASQMFPDLKSASQAMVKIMAGQELGMTPFNSIKNINIIQGKPELSAGALSSLVKSSGRYDYKVREWDDKHCILEWYDLKIWGKDPIGTSSFNEEEARIAGLSSKDNWRKFAKAMYFARAMSQGVRTYCPNVSSGAIYLHGEITGQIPNISTGKTEHEEAPF